MQNYPGDPDGRPELLPTHSDDRKVSALTIARINPQALSTDFRAGPESAESSDEINFLDYWRILVKRRWTVLATIAMVMVIGLVGTLMTTPIYRAVAIVQI